MDCGEKKLTMDDYIKQEENKVKTIVDYINPEQLKFLS